EEGFGMNVDPGRLSVSHLPVNAAQAKPRDWSDTSRARGLLATHWLSEQWWKWDGSRDTANSAGSPCPQAQTHACRQTARPPRASACVRKGRICPHGR